MTNTIDETTEFLKDQAILWKMKMIAEGFFFGKTDCPICGSVDAMKVRLNANHADGSHVVLCQCTNCRAGLFE